MRFVSLLSFVAGFFFFLLINTGMAANLSQDDAKRVLEDTKTIESYLDLKGESDYVGKPQNIIKAALFGAFDAKVRFIIQQEDRKEAGKKALSDTTVLFTINGQSVTADQILMREEAPEVFKDSSKTFTCFITRKAVALAAEYFTGHTIKEHLAPKDDESFWDTVLNDKGYFVGIEGLGDAPTEAVLKKVETKGDGFVITGEVIEVLGNLDEKSKPGSFRLELKPGDVPGSWKRQYQEEGVEK